MKVQILNSYSVCESLKTPKNKQINKKQKTNKDPLLYPEKINAINKPTLAFFILNQKKKKISNKANGTHDKIDDLANKAKWR